MRIFFIVIVMFLIILINVNAGIEPSRYFCERQGYTFKLLTEKPTQEDMICVFDDENQCTSWGFFTGSCGQEYRKEFPCVEEGEYVFSQFDKCCEGLEPSTGWWKKIVGQPHCIEKLSFFQKIKIFIKTIFE